MYKVFLIAFFNHESTVWLFYINICEGATNPDFETEYKNHKNFHNFSKKNFQPK